MQKATEAYKVFLNTFGENDPMEYMKVKVAEIKNSLDGFRNDTFRQLASILSRIGVNEKGEKTNNVSKTVKPSSDTNNKPNLRPIDEKELKEATTTIKNSRKAPLYNDKNGAGYGGNFGKGFDLAGARFTHGVHTDSYGEMVKGIGEYVAQPFLNLFGVDADNVDRWFNGESTKKPKVKDGVMSSNGNSMFTQATNVTPINDGKVQIAKSDPKDTAVFAKTGGPFDTLFNDVFGRINDVYNEVHNETYSNTSSDVIPTEPFGKDVIFAESPSMFTQATNDGKVQIDPVNIKIDGKLELTGSNGQTVDIISELNNNPMLLRAISDMIVQNISTKYYGGRPVGNSNFRK